MQSNNQRISELCSAIVQRIRFAAGVLAYTGSRQVNYKFPFVFLGLWTGLMCAWSFCCYDSAGSIDPSDAFIDPWDAFSLESWHLCSQSFLTPPKSFLWNLSTKKSTSFAGITNSNSICVWQLCLAGTLAPHYCSSASKSGLSFPQCQPGSESSICLQLCQMWDSSCFRNKLYLLFGWCYGFENQIVVLLIYFPSSARAVTFSLESIRIPPITGGQEVGATEKNCSPAIVFGCAGLQLSYPKVVHPLQLQD